MAAQQIPLHVLNGPHGPLVAVQVLQRPVHRRGGGNEGDDPAPGDGLDLLNGDKVQRVRHGDTDIGAGYPDGDHRMLFRNIFGQDLGHLGRDAVAVQVDELHAQLAHQGVDKLLLGDKTVLLQHRAQTLAGA